MRTLPCWHYDEFRHVGTDYADPVQAEIYDARHQQFRGDMAAEADHLLDMLGIMPGQTLVDLGCGTGTLAIQAAKRGIIVYAVDVSRAMLTVAQRKADRAGVGHITFCHGGFLTYAHQAQPADVVISANALHHLSDFWKLIGLRRISEMLGTGGLFYLSDVVYSFDPGDYVAVFEQAVSWFADTVNASMAEDAARHYRDEHSTCDWIMEGLLTRAGFSIEQALYPNNMRGQYWCRKEKRVSVD